MAYVFLVVAVGCEVVATSLLKATQGFTRLGEGITTTKVLGLAMVVGGVILLNVGGAHAH